jgi:hypothetical protein
VSSEGAKKWALAHVVLAASGESGAAGQLNTEVEPVYVRFVVTIRDARSGHQQGIFTALYALEREGQLAASELDWFHSIEEWFNEHLTRPERLTWSSRPNAPQRAITWLKMSASEHVSRMRELVALLEHKDVPVEELRTEKPGYVVYEVQHQVAAVPFGAETF